MREITGNLFTLMHQLQPDAVCITTNAMRRKNGHGIMGAGNAKQCKQHVPNAEQYLAEALDKNGHITQIFCATHAYLVSFPTKHHFNDPSDKALIQKSAHELMALIERYQWSHVLVPPPGCTNGHLTWIEVKHILDPIFDDRITIVHPR